MSNEEMKLTKDQERAKRHFEGPMLVVAGPGSGKTEILLQRIEYLIQEKHVNPSAILACTFTNKATDNIKFRLAKRIGTKAEEVYVSTIHAFCSQILREYPDYHEFGESFEVLDGEAQSMLVRALYWGQLQLSNSGLIKKRGGIESLIDCFNLLSRNLIDPEKLRKYYEAEQTYDDLKRRILRAYDLYIGHLISEKKIDFSYLQRYFQELITSHPEFLKLLQDRFYFALVDEFQDVSPIQFKIIRAIFETKERNNIFAVGDDDQSIYGWRGTDSEIFSSFIKINKDCKTAKLTQNFRSTRNILNSANFFMARKSKIKKQLQTNNYLGNRVVLIQGEDCKDAAKRTIEFIKLMKATGKVISYGDFTLLFRSVKYHASEYIEEIQNEGLPFIVYGKGSLLDRDDIGSMLYFMTYVTQEVNGDKKLLTRATWWNVRQFTGDFLALSPETKEVLINTEQEFKISDLKRRKDFIRLGIKNEEDINKLLGLNGLRENILANHKDRKKRIGVLRIFYRVLDKSGYLKEYLNSEDTPETEERLYNAARLSQIISTYERSYNRYDMKSLLWHFYRSRENKTYDEVFIEDSNSIKLMTIHQAKGLEFPVVIIGSLIKGRFPSTRKGGKNLIDIPDNFYLRLAPFDEPKEQERLFYVGITRAQDILALAGSEKVNVQRRGLSPFIAELGVDHLCCIDEVAECCTKQYEIPKKAVYLSYSALDTYLMCPYLYKLSYEYGFSTPATYFQNYGLILHTALMRINKSLQKKCKYELEDVINNSWMPLPMADKKIDEIKREVQRVLKNYIKDFTTRVKEILAVEKPFIVIGDEYIIAGKADLVFRDHDNQINLVDFKARHQEGIEKTNVREQMQLYNYCLKKEYSIDKMYAYTLLDNKETGVAYNEDTIKEILTAFSNSVLNNNYPKNLSHCNDCFFNFCCGEIK